MLVDGVCSARLGFALQVLARKHVPYLPPIADHGAASICEVNPRIPFVRLILKSVNKLTEAVLF